MLPSREGVQSVNAIDLFRSTVIFYCSDVLEIKNNGISRNPPTTRRFNRQQQQIFFAFNGLKETPTADDE